MPQRHVKRVYEIEMSFGIEGFLFILVGAAPLILEGLVNSLENLFRDLWLGVCSRLSTQRERQRLDGEIRALLLSVLFSEGFQR
jgi:hypothetical protein